MVVPSPLAAQAGLRDGGPVEIELAGSGLVIRLAGPASLAELLLPLVTGGRVIAAPVTARLDPGIFAAVAGKHQPSVIQATPSFWRLALAWGWTGAPGSRLWCGGEALTASLAARLLRTGRELWNMYGPTEATIWATASRIRSPAAIGLGGFVNLCLFVEA